jgi:crotonobetainyl-CoA:carnitine CoA-transferase CaiB-like acyl-CoA transferase
MPDSQAHRNDPRGPLAGVRVLEVSANRPGRVAGMLLAALGADVVRIAPGTYADAGRPADETPDGDAVLDSLAWDRGKRLLDPQQRPLADFAPGADVFLADHSPGELDRLGIDARTLRGATPGLVHVWLPPYATRGEWSETTEHPLLLAAVSGVSGRYPATEDRPVAPVLDATTLLQGVLGAAAAAAGLVGRQRSGAGREAVVTGLHAAAALLATVTARGIDQEVRSAGRSGRAWPFWRFYQASDGKWLFLATLGPRLFFRALEAMDRMDIMVLPGVDGEYSNLMVSELGGRVVGEALEQEFRSRSSAHWLELLAKADVPCAEVWDREAWAASDIVGANHLLESRPHPDLGQVQVTALPVTFSGTQPGPAPFAEPSGAQAPDQMWTTAGAAAGPARPWSADGTDAAAPALPLTGLRVIDTSAFLAGPFVGALLADWGADVVKVEPPAGDPFRANAVAVMVASQRKRGIAVDIASEAGRPVLFSLLDGADVLIENFRPGRLAAKGLGFDVLHSRSPGLVQCAVTGFGQAGSYAAAPAFDPIAQALSGMAAAQGGQAEPVSSDIPLTDTVTGALGALGVLSAVYHRGETLARTGEQQGQLVYISLAQTATFLQSRELTVFDGRPAVPPGGRDFPGPDQWRHLYQGADGWIAVAATTAGQRARLADVLRAADLDATENALRAVPTREAVALLTSSGIPAVRVALLSGLLDEPFLVENGF